MKKLNSVISILIILFLLLTWMPQPVLAAGVWNGGKTQPAGEGTSASPYQIGTAEELAWLAEKVNGNGGAALYAELTADIALNDTSNLANWGENAPANTWTPIGSSTNRFAGCFNGNNHTISGVYINNSSDYQALFGYIAYNGTVKNLKIADSYIKAGSYAGGVCGYNSSGTIENCSNSATISGSGITGGICGYNYMGTITYCRNSGTIASSGTGTQYGGICGTNYGTISNSYNTGAVYVPGKNIAGGICGFNSKTITTAYSSGTVSGNNNAGLFCGLASNVSSLSDCYFLGSSADTGIGTNGGSGTATYKSAAEFSSGTVAYLLRSAFGQTLGTDALPVFKTADGSNAVYKLTYMNGSSEFAVQYYNSGNAISTALFDTPVSDSGNFVGWEGLPATMPAYDLTVTAVFNPDSPATPRITTTTLAAGYTDVAYSAQIEAEGTGNLTFSIASGYLPDGLSLDSATGLISGTPTLVGTRTFIVRVLSDTGAYDQQELSLVIRQSAPTITTTSLPPGTLNALYSASITAQGITPFTFSVYSGSLPGGLSLNSSTGEISGTPAATGTSSFTISVANDKGTAYQELSIEIADGLQGSGTSGQPYLIYTAQQLRLFANKVNGNSGGALYAKLMADVALNDTGDVANWATDAPDNIWTPIGNNITNRFVGSFDGNNHTISGIYTNAAGDYMGLFGYLGINSIIQNIRLTDSYITGSAYTGGICGFSMNGGQITNCVNAAAVVGTGTYTGGICGFLNNSSAESCCNTGTVTGPKNTGGIAGGTSSGSTIARCRNAGAVGSNGTGTQFGGVCGVNYGIVSNSYNTGLVSASGNNNVGGICGTNSGSVSNVFNTGTVAGYSSAGMVCGYAPAAGVFTNCWFLGSSSDTGIGNNLGSGTAACGSTAEFSSGAIAYVLGNAFGQTLGTDAAPVFHTDTNAVYKLTYMDGSDVFAVQYYNCGNPVSASAVGTPTSGGIFTGWDGLPDTMPNSDVTVYAEFTTASASILPTSATFDKYSDSPYCADISVTMTLCGNTLSGIWNGTSSLTQGTDYTISGSNVTILKSYLAALNTGNTYLTFKFSAGDDQTLTVTVADTTPPRISPDTVTYDLSSPGDVEMTITWNSAQSVASVAYNSSALTKNTDYVVSGNTLTIFDSYLSNQGFSKGDKAKFEITFDTGAAVTLTVNIEDNYTPNSDATLSYITVGGKTITFAPGTYSCDVILPCDTQPGSAAATVSAVATDPKAAVNIAQASSLPGSATITVTAEDNTTILTYTVNFALEAKPNNAPKARSIVPVQNVAVNGTAAFNASDIAEDADGDTLEITSIERSPDPDTASAELDSGMVTVKGISAGDTSVIVRVSDGTDAVDVTVPIAVTDSHTAGKTLISIIAPSAVTGLANGTAKTASALGLPATVMLATDGGNVSASVTWDVASCSYDAGSAKAQTFTVSGMVTLPDGVINPDNISLTTSISVSVLAAEETVGDFVVTTDNPSGYTYNAGDGALQFTQPGSYTVSMKSGVTIATNSKIQINGGTSSEPIVILLNNVSIQNGYCAFDVKNTSCANLILLDGTVNSITSGDNYPGIRCLPGATITIGGAGTLNVQGGLGGAGIGGDSVSNYNSGNISIAGGTVVATGGQQGAGIGGGFGGKAGIITVSGGTVTATGGGAGGLGGAGIGGGANGNGGTVYISGGSVKATGVGGAQNIGRGFGGSESGTLMNKPAAEGGVNVYLTTITLENVSAATAVASLTASLNSVPYTYGLTDMFTDAQGKLYLYLPENTSTTAAQTSDGATPPALATYIGSIETTNNHLAAGTLSLLTPSQLAAPAGLAWDGATPGKATWSAVANASSYTVQLYKGGAAQGGAVTGVTDTEYDFTSVIAAAGSGDYTFMVTAVGDGVSYTDSDPSAESAVYSYTAPVTDATISPDTGSFDKNPANQADVTTTITWNDATGVTDVKAGGVTIGAGNYTVSGDTLAIKKEYLAAQPTGSLALTVEFNAGAPATLTITIADTTPPAINPASRNYDLNAPADVTTTITWNSAASVTEVVYSVRPDTTLYMLNTGNYTITGDTLTIGNTFFAGLSLTTGDVLDFAISFDTGATSTLTVSVVNGYVPSSNANLSSLAVNGTPVSGFDPDDTEYDVELPYGSTSATVTATAEDPLASCVITDAPSLPGSATVTVTAEDGTTKTYTINITVAAVPVIAVTDITGVPATATAGTPLALTGTVVPANATNQTIVWSIQNAGTTGATISGNTLSAAAAGTVIVRATITKGASESTDYTQDFSITVTTAPVTTYTITASAGSGGSISPSGAVSVASGGSQTFTITPNSGYRIDAVTVDGVGQGAITTYAFTNVTSNHTINAAFTRTSGGGGDSGISTSPTPAYEAAVSGNKISKTTLPVSVNSNAGSATADLGTLTKDIFAGTETAVLTMPAVSGVSSYTLELPAASLSGSQGEGALTFSTNTGSVTIPSGMLEGMAGTEGKKAGITIAQVDKSGLPDDVKTAIGDRPIVQLTLTLDGTQTEWNNPNAPVTVSIPYTPTATELANPESIVVWYIDSSGNAVSVPNGRYDAATGTVTFTATHFSYYAVSFKQVSFKDVAKDAWYARAVSFIAAREITSGTGNGNFSPEAKLTRGAFLVMLMKAYGIAPDLNPEDNFADAGSTWYTGHLAAARRLGISAGVGNNMFAPEKEITRQEMFTLLYNALKVIGKLPRGNSGKSLSDFSDAGDIAQWAKDAVTMLVETGTIGGSENRLSPKDTATRAQMAQVLYSLLSK